MAETLNEKNMDDMLDMAITGSIQSLGLAATLLDQLKNERTFLITTIGLLLANSGMYELKITTQDFKSMKNYKLNVDTSIDGNEITIKLMFPDEVQDVKVYGECK